MAAWEQRGAKAGGGRRRRASRESRANRGLRRLSVLAGLHEVRLRQRLRVRHVRIPLAGLGLRFVVLADIHADADLMPAPEIRAIVDAVNRVPDVDAVLLPGDFVGHDPAAMAFCSVELARIEAPAFASIGNHDLEADDHVVRAGLEAAGIAVLVNDAVELRAAAGARRATWIGGLDSLAFGDPDVAAMRRALPRDVDCVVLGHEPALATRHSELLHVAGHTHHGQVRVPLLPPLVLPSFSRPYVAGLHEVPVRGGGRRWVYTTAGVGSTTLPLRIGAPPEIVVIDC